MNLLKAIDFMERLAKNTPNEERFAYRDIKEWLELLDGLITCIGYGVCHTWGMKDRECLDRCFEMIEEYEEKLER